MKGGTPQSRMNTGWHFCLLILRRVRETYSVEEVMVDLKESGVVLGKDKKSDVAEECRFSYKDIETVIANEAYLVKVVKRLSTLGVVKG